MSAAKTGITEPPPEENGAASVRDLNQRLGVSPTVDQQSSQSKIELTAREKAIARGDDPDAVVPVANEPARQATADEPDSAAQPINQPASQAPSPSWINDDVKIVAGSLGLSDDELKEFSSAGEFLRFSRLMDRRIAGLAKAPQQQESGQGQVNQPQPGRPQAEQTQPSQSQQPAPSQSVSSTPNTGAATSPAKPLTPVDPEWYKANGYDEQTVALAQATRDTQELLNSLLTLSVALKFNKGDEQVEEIFSAILSVTGTKKAAITQSVGTSEEAILKGEITTPGYILIFNKDYTNYVSIRAGTGQTNRIKVPLRGIALFMFEATTPYWVANGSACEVKYVLIDA